jgi:hypothetical protein
MRHPFESRLTQGPAQLSTIVDVVASMHAPALPVAERGGR